MSDELNLPKPPDGYFWRIKHSLSGSLIDVQLRVKFLGVFSLLETNRLTLLEGVTAAFIERVATQILDEQAALDESVAKSSRWLGEYYR